MSVRKQLEADRALAFWRDLAPHAQKGAVFVVEDGLDMLDVGEAMAKNDAKAVEGWVVDGSLRRPTPDEHKMWDDTPGTYFDMVIVEPFVLIKPADREPDADVGSDPEEATLEEIAKFAARPKPD